MEGLLLVNQLIFQISSEAKCLTWDFTSFILQKCRRTFLFQLLQYFVLDFFQVVFLNGESKCFPSLKSSIEAFPQIPCSWIYHFPRRPVLVPNPIEDRHWLLLFCLCTLPNGQTVSRCRFYCMLPSTRLQPFISCSLKPTSHSVFSVVVTLFLLDLWGHHIRLCFRQASSVLQLFYGVTFSPRSWSSNFPKSNLMIRNQIFHFALFFSVDFEIQNTSYFHVCFTRSI